MKRILLVLFSFVSVSSAYAETSSFTRLMAAGQSVECEFHKNDGSQRGTIFVAGEKMRGEFIVQQGSSESPMHMIRDTEKMYTWGGPMGETTGMVMSSEMGKASGPLGGMQTTNMDEEMDFTCKDWPADESQFQPPADVAFQDMGQLMAGLAAAQGNTQ